ncbi:hypothetical protein V2G26_010134 [Clonostachys chloroleuca]
MLQTRVKKLSARRHHPRPTANKVPSSSPGICCPSMMLIGAPDSGLDGLAEPVSNSGSVIWLVGPCGTQGVSGLGQ